MLINSNKSLKLSFALSFFSLTACSVIPYSNTDAELSAKVSGLKQILLTINPNAEPKEANLLASTAINYSLSLVNQYEIASNPILHNILVNHGFKDRGLCIHWTEDLLRKLSTLQLKDFKLHWGVAHRESSFRLEHSAVIVTSPFGVFSEGVVLDPWRNSGKLYFNFVKDDQYPWTKQYNKITESILFQLE